MGGVQLWGRGDRVGVGASQQALLCPPGPLAGLLGHKSAGLRSLPCGHKASCGLMSRKASRGRQDHVASYPHHIRTPSPGHSSPGNPDGLGTPLPRRGAHTITVVLQVGMDCSTFPSGTSRHGMNRTTVTSTTYP